MKLALCVAHPDDETLWFGGLVIANPGDWTVICCSTPRADPERTERFFLACKALGAVGIVMGTTETPASQPLALTRDILVGLARYDVIVTHNAVGEYGHVHHAALHRAIAAEWAEKVVTGGYGMPDEEPWRIALTPDEYARKLAALRCYDHVSPLDGKPKWEALLERYTPHFDLRVETYSRAIP